MSLAEEKRTLRREMLDRRRQLSPAAVAKATQAVMNRLDSLSAFQEASCCLTYLSADNEISTVEVISCAFAQAKLVFVPSCLPGGRLHWSRLRPSTVLKCTRFGILEPAFPEEPWERGGEQVVALVPGLAFGPAGQRLGYGGGYFDRFLEDFDGQAFGLAHDFQVVDVVPEASHDRRVSVVITDRAVYPRHPQASTNPINS